jgi:hypothetical protein
MFFRWGSANLPLVDPRSTSGESQIDFVDLRTTYLIPHRRQVDPRSMSRIPEQHLLDSSSTSGGSQIDFVDPRTTSGGFHIDLCLSSLSNFIGVARAGLQICVWTFAV